MRSVKGVLKQRPDQGLVVAGKHEIVEVKDGQIMRVVPAPHSYPIVESKTGELALRVLGELTSVDQPLRALIGRKVEVFV